MAAYATSDDMIDRFDERTLGELCSDTDTAVTDLENNTKMQTALDDSTGAMKAALQVGNQYSDTDLESLTDESLAYRKRLCCEIALAYLIRRRPEKYNKSSKDVREGVEAILEQLRKGERVFDVDANRAASLPTIGGPSGLDYQRLNMIPDRTKNFFPHRETRLPFGR